MVLIMIMMFNRIMIVLNTMMNIIIHNLVCEGRADNDKAHNKGWRGRNMAYTEEDRE